MDDPSNPDTDAVNKGQIQSPFYCSSQFKLIPLIEGWVPFSPPGHTGLWEDIHQRITKTHWSSRCSVSSELGSFFTSVPSQIAHSSVRGPCSSSALPLAILDKTKVNRTRDDSRCAVIPLLQAATNFSFQNKILKGWKNNRTISDLKYS